MNPAAYGITLADVEAARGMKIEKEFPPNIADIEAIFPGVTARSMGGIYFCYGNVIYNPSGKVIAPELIAHEICHSIQTEAVGGPEEFWDMYLAAEPCRREFETEAHRIEYQYCQLHNNRHFRRRAKKAIAQRLAGPLYGNLMTVSKAERLIIQ